MRQAEIFYKDVLAGILIEVDKNEYTFQYYKKYIVHHPQQFLSFTMPVTDKIYTSSRLFPVFEGLLPEGWLLGIASEKWKISPDDKMGLLMVCCENCIGAVSVKGIKKEFTKM